MIVDTAKWLNDNQGVVSLLIFALTIFGGWITGIFSALRRRPKLRINLIDGPTFCSTFSTGEKYNEFDVHRTGFALYLQLSNVGSAPTSIDSVKLGYQWHVRPLSLIWLKHRFFWFWLESPAVALEDFQFAIGEKVKFYPFLLQRSTISGQSANTYLQVGQSVNGVVYFEQSDSWGGFFPSPKNGRTKVRVAVLDAFGRSHKETFSIPVVSLQEARKFNPSFGDTLPALRSETPG
ncbi:hypothetical protein [Bradyrhizobium cenepequi]|uniref:hypothetical protein n=1 Tax=Bradyrhizobium cenepequi TaxID=2821403 RepID=UPI001CE2B46A|nr:hypothetical protein [Bradyrhizobium cenepequi]MCA6112125.1 hypothetical protein [Bradyrhizobium cenepequi]